MAKKRRNRKSWAPNPGGTMLKEHRQLRGNMDREIRRRAKNAKHRKQLTLSARQRLDILAKHKPPAGAVTWRESMDAEKWRFTRRYFDSSGNLVDAVVVMPDGEKRVRSEQLRNPPRMMSGAMQSTSGETILPLDVDDGDTFSASFMGEVDFGDGCGPRAIDGITAQCDDSSHPFGACYSGDGSLCCRISLQAEPEVDTLPGSTCSTPDCDPRNVTLGLNNNDIECEGSSIFGSFDPTDGYFIGDSPIPGYNNSSRLVVFCDGGTVDAFLLDSDNCVLDPGVDSVTWDSATFMGEIVLDPVLGQCCHNGENGTAYRIQLS